MGMTLKELLTKGEGTLSAQEAKTLAAQCRMDVETLYTLLEERGIKIIEDEADADVNLDVDSIIAEVENAENNSDELGLGGEDEEEAAEENPADLKAAMDELLDDPVKNYLKQIGQIPLLSAEQEVDLSKRIHAGAEAAHILQADRQKYGAPEYIKKNSARFSFEEDENSRSYTEDLDEDGEKSAEDAEEKADEEKAMDMSVERVREIQRMAQEPASLESPVGEEEDSSLGDFVADENAEAPGKAADRAMVAQQINLALKSLTPREEKVIRLRFGLDDGRPRTLEEVGRDFGVTRERVRQIEAKAIRKLHSRKCLTLLNGLIE